MPDEAKPILFPVFVSLKEGTGRIVEGNARGHELAADPLSSRGSAQLELAQEGREG